MFEENFKAAIQKYLDAEPHKKSAFKGVITRLINSLPDVTFDKIQKVIAEFKDLPEEIAQRFTEGSLYESNGLVYGWTRKNQFQAEPIPVYMSWAKENGRYIKVLKDRLDEGFAEAVPLPLLDKFVKVPWQKTDIYARHGWANPCKLQWYWEEGENYAVSRSIIPHGFWQAWKWWDGARNWYLDHRPELFEDAELWGEKPPVYHEPPNPYSAVLGGKNKDFWEQSKFYID